MRRKISAVAWLHRYGRCDRLALNFNAALFGNFLRVSTETLIDYLQNNARFGKLSLSIFVAACSHSG